MEQDDLDAKLLRNFEEGLARLDIEKSEDVLSLHAAPNLTGEEVVDRLINENSPLTGRVIEAAACRVIMAIRASRWLYCRSIQPDQSPLEAVLAAAIHVVGENVTDEAVILGWCESESGEHRELKACADAISVCQQHRVDPYRIDIMVSGYRHVPEISAVQHMASVAVEVDGHEFHEKTKEQAQHDKAKDRAIQLAGYKVFRYTGAEVWRDPIRCAQQVVAAALGQRPKRRGDP